MQADVRKRARLQFTEDGWTTVQGTEEQPGLMDGGIWCELVPLNAVKAQLATAYRKSFPEYRPGCKKLGKGIVTYHRFGNDEGLEPLILRRSFGGTRESADEVVEEFRLFHNLFHEAKSNAYLKIRDDGNEEEVVRTKT